LEELEIRMYRKKISITRAEAETQLSGRASGRGALLRVRLKLLTVDIRITRRVCTSVHTVSV